MTADSSTPENEFGAPGPGAAPKPIWDRIGMTASVLCVVHCLMLPTLIPLAAAVGLSWLVTETVEWFLLLATLSFAAVVLLRGCKHHQRRLPLVLVGAGGIAYFSKELLGHDLEPLFVFMGGSLIVAAHFLNLRFCRSCSTCQVLAQ